MTHGPNVSKLIVVRMAQRAIPAKGGLQDAVKFLDSPARIKATAAEATRWVEAALNAVKASPDNPYPDDETIAGAILTKMAEVKRETRRHAR